MTLLPMDEDFKFSVQDDKFSLASIPSIPTPPGKEKKKLPLEERISMKKPSSPLAKKKSLSPLAEKSPKRRPSLELPDDAFDKLVRETRSLKRPERPLVVDTVEKPVKKSKATIVNDQFMKLAISKIDFFLNNRKTNEAETSFKELKKVLNKRKSYKKFKEKYKWDFKRISTSIEYLEL